MQEREIAKAMAVPIEENRAKETVWSGNLIDFLQKHYLPEYISSLPKYFPRPELADQISPILEEFLPKIISSFLNGRSELIGSIGKSLMYYVLTCLSDSEKGQGILPPKHWDYRPEIAKKINKKMNRNKFLDQPGVIEFFRSFLEDPDADIKMQFKDPETKMADLAKSLHSDLRKSDKYSERLSQLNIVKEKNEKDGKIYKGAAFDIFYSKNIRIHIFAGQIVTNPDIGIMRFSIHDKRGDKVTEGKRVKDGKSVFHMDFTDMPITAEAAATDARAGATFDWQDKTSIHLKTMNENTIFELPLDSIRRLFEQDIFIIKPDMIDANNLERAWLSETIFRMPRTHLQLNLPLVVIRDDGNPARMEHLPDLDKFYPRIKAENLFDLGRRIKELAERGIGFRERSLTLVQKELAMCFWIDPWETIQFLRDTGIYLLIPGWRDLTSKNWDDILSSEQLCIEPISEGTAISRIEERRSPEFWLKQRSLYRQGAYFDGLERVMRAFGIKTDNEIIAFLKLWNIPKIDIIREDAKKAPKGFTLTTSIDGDVLIYQRIGKQISAAALARRLSRIGANKEINWTEQVEEAKKVIISHVKNLSKYSIYGQDRLSTIINKVQSYVSIKSISESQKGDSITLPRLFKSELPAWMDSLALIFAYLDAFPSGVTAKDLSTFYKSIRMKTLFGNLEDFTQTFLDLKLLGLIQMADLKVDLLQEKITQKYFISEETGITFLKLIDPINLIEAFEQITGIKNGEDFDSNRKSRLSKRRIKRYINRARGMVSTYEAAAVMTEDDLLLLNIQKNKIKSTYHDLRIFVSIYDLYLKKFKIN